MSLQKEMRNKQVRGIVGEFSDASPKSARQYIVYGTDGKGGTAKPKFGKFFSIKGEILDSGSSDKTIVAIQGTANTSWSMGILVNPKEHFTHGFVTTLEMDSGTAGTIATRGHIWVDAANTVVAGGKVFVDANGNLGGTGLASSTQVLGAKWLTSRTYVSGKVNLAEIAIDNPVLNSEIGPSV